MVNLHFKELSYLKNFRIFLRFNVIYIEFNQSINENFKYMKKKCVKLMGCGPWLTVIF